MEECIECGYEKLCLDYGSDEAQKRHINTFSRLPKAKRIPLQCSWCSEPYWYYPRTGKITRRKTVEGTRL